VCHVALAQEGHCNPGEVLGTDSHTCNAGAFGQCATGVGNTDAGFILGTGKLLIKVPPTMRFQLEDEVRRRAARAPRSAEGWGWGVAVQGRAGGRRGGRGAAPRRAAGSMLLMHTARRAWLARAGQRGRVALAPAFVS
jgi:hypothetical protein